MRIISICPSNTEILFALGLMDQVVAIDDFSDWPPADTSRLPHLGPDLNIDMDKLQSFQPDLVVASLSVPGMEINIERLRERNIAHIVLNPKTIEDILGDILLLGQHTHTLDTAQKIVSALRQRMETVQHKIEKRIETPRLYWEWWPRPYISPAAGNWLTEVSQIAGAVNIFADQPGDSVIDMSGDKVISQNPDYIMAVWTGVKSSQVDAAKIRSRNGWEAMPATRSNRIFVLEEGLYCRPSPRLFDGIEQLAQLLHPDLA